MNALPQLARFSIPTNLDLSVLDKILSNWNWPWIRKTIIATRTYEEGLEAGVAMYGFLEDHRERLTEFAYNDYATKLLWFILEMMDGSDQWEEYLLTWESIRENTDFYVARTEGPLWKHTPPLERKQRKERTPFVLEIDPEPEREPELVDVASTPFPLEVREYDPFSDELPVERRVKVHFLWLTLRRKELIEKKVKKARAGKKVGNLYHKTRADLTSAEIESRIEWITRIANEIALKYRKP